MKNKFIIPGAIVLLLAVILGASILLQKGQAIAVPETVKIGVIAPMSGDAASYGDYVIKSLKMSVEDYNKNNKIQFDVVYEDGKCDGKEAVTAYTKLTTVDNVKYIIGGFCSGETLAIAPLAEKDHVLLFSAGSGSPDITNAGNYIFRNLVSDDFTAKEIANIAVKNGDNKMVIINESTDYAQALNKTFTKYYTEQGGKVVLSESFDKATTDFHTIIAKAKDQKVNSAYIVTQTDKTAALILKQMKEQGYSPKIYTNEAVIGPESLKYYDASYKGLLEGAIFTQPKFDASNPKTAALLAEYTAKYGSSEGPLPATYLATFYDSVNILGEALNNKGDNVDGVVSYFNNSIKNWPGTVGNFSFDANGDAVTDVEAKTVKNGQIVPLN